MEFNVCVIEALQWTPHDEGGLLVSLCYSLRFCCTSFAIPYTSHSKMDVKNVPRVKAKSAGGIIPIKEMSASDCALFLGILKWKSVLCFGFLIVYIGFLTAEQDCIIGQAYGCLQACFSYPSGIQMEASMSRVHITSNHCQVPIQTLFQGRELVFTWEFGNKVW